MNNQWNPTNSQRNHGFNTNKPNVVSSRTTGSIPTVAQPVKPPRKLCVWNTFIARLVMALLMVIAIAIGIGKAIAMSKGK